jgi:3-isopropylmalate dehydrogenase
MNNLKSIVDYFQFSPSVDGSGRSFNIAVIPGDGIGPEVTMQSVKVLDAIAAKFNHTFNYTYAQMGAVAIESTGNPLPDETIEICKKSDAILFGAIGHPKYDNDPTARVRPEQGLLKLRKSLQLFANIRPINTYPSLHHLSPLKSKQLQDVDFVIYRELTGGIYFGEKKTNEDQSWASDGCEYTKEEIERIAHEAFKAAMQRRKKLTLVDKSNVLETSRLWRKVVKDIAPQYPLVAVDFLYIDNAAMQIIVNPKQFDVLLTENLFGDILSDEASVISGSLGLLPSASIGVYTAMFEPIHGSYPQAAGKDIANPLGSILSAAMMLDYLQLPNEAAIVRAAVEWTIQNLFVTKDIDPINFYFTSTIGELIGEYVHGRVSNVFNQENIELRKSTII